MSMMSSVTSSVMSRGHMHDIVDIEGLQGCISREAFEFKVVTSYLRWTSGMECDFI